MDKEKIILSWPEARPKGYPVNLCLPRVFGVVNPV